MKKLKIGLMGYGRMGKEIESAAIERTHEVVLKITRSNADFITPDDLKQCDVIIEFTRPDAVLNNIRRCLENNIAVVVGTTGWYQHLNEVKDACSRFNGALFYASNFSIGVNILFEINARLAALMNRRTEYDAEISEVHHIHKLDKPSGTAITLAEGILQQLKRKARWTLEQEQAKDADLLITSYREDEVVGKHSVRYTSATDEIEIVHNAFSRKGFAYGAVLAAEFLYEKKGVYTMKDILEY
jgi:4-hydroxy-tetrahydrodipicolinate reductase